METVLSLHNISKEFDSIKVLDNINIRIKKNEVIGLVGENGAGKSTLMKILLGIYQPENGVIRNETGDVISIQNPYDAAKNGLGMVFQEGSLISGLNIAENLFLGHEHHFCKFNFLLQHRIRKSSVTETLDMIGLSQYFGNTLVDELSISEKQMLEIGRLLWLSKLYHCDNPILILDEPTTVLSKNERDILFSHINDLKKNCTFIFISHQIEEILELSDRIIVLRDGSLIDELSVCSASAERVEELIIGDSPQAGTPTDILSKPFPSKKEKVLLDIQKLTVSNSFENVSFQLYAGEILSFVGLVGSGKEELIETFFGLQHIESGTIAVDGKVIEITKPRDAIQHGFGLIPINRRDEGLATELSVLDNISLLSLKYLKKLGLLSKKLITEFSLEKVKQFNVKISRLDTACKFLSGGNQQKIVLAKWFSTKAKVFILNHPTRGIDVGSKHEIFNSVKSMARIGYSFIVLCDSLDEDMIFSDRMILMKEKHIVDEIILNGDIEISPSDVLAKIL